MKFKWSKNLLNSMKEKETKTLTNMEIEEIKRKAIEEYLDSDEFKEEIDSVVKNLGEEWFATYKKDNSSKNNDGDKIIKDINNKLDNKSQIEELSKEFEVEGFGEKPTVIKLKELDNE